MRDLCLVYQQRVCVLPMNGLLSRFKKIVIIADFKCMRPGVSSPRVSKGCLESNPFGINVILAKAALADARATNTAHATEKKITIEMDKLIGAG